MALVDATISLAARLIRLSCSLNGRRQVAGVMVMGCTMSDSGSSLQMLNLIRAHELHVRGSATRAEDRRADLDRQLEENRRAAGSVREAIKLDRRPASLQRRLEFSYGTTPGFSGAKTNRGVSRLAAAEIEQLRHEYRQLLSRIDGEVEELINVAESWKELGFFKRLFSPSRRPALPTKELADDLVTLNAWADALLDRERGLFIADLDRQLGKIRDVGFVGLQEQEAADARHAVDQRLEIEAMKCAFGVPAAAWTDPIWNEPRFVTMATSSIRLGRYLLDLPGPGQVADLPATIDFPFSAGLVMDAETSSRSAAVALARSTCLRLLSAIPAGQLRFTFIDPVALGQSVAEFQHLADFDPELVGTRPVTSARDIEARLSDLSEHIETVISNYLRGQSRVDRRLQRRGRRSC